MKSCFAVLVFIAVSGALGQSYSPAASRPRLQSEHIPFERIQFEHITIEQGLSQSTVYSVLQDKTGFVWFATQDGLNRYDGYSFRVYRKETSADVATLRHSLTSNWILDLHQGRSERLWVITRSGVDLYNPATEDFTPFHSIADESVKTATTQRLNSNNMTAWTEDKRGDFWVATDKGLNHYDAASLTMSDIQIFRGIRVFAVKEDYAGRLWVATERGLFQQMSSTQAFVSVPLPIQGAITAIGEDINGNVYVAVGDSPCVGVAVIPTKGEIVPFHPETAFPTALRTKSTVQDIRSDVRGQMWLRTSTGILLFTPPISFSGNAVPRVTALFNNPADSTSLSSNAVSVLMEDSHGTMWIGTANGLNLYNPNRKELARYRYDPSEPKSLSSNIVRCITQDRFGTVWVGTDIGGANMWNPSKQQFAVFRRNPYNPHTLSDNSIRAFAEETPTTFWVGTDNGLNLVNITTGHVERVVTPGNQSIRALHKDADGSLWLGTNGSGLLRYNTRTKTFQQFPYNPLDSLGLSSDRIRVIFRDKQQRLWIGAITASMGQIHHSGGLVLLYDDRKRTFTRFLANPTNLTSLSNSDVRCMTEDSKGRLWVGTYGGLCLFVPPNDVQNPSSIAIFKQFHSNPDDQRTLASDIISCVKEDASGRLWIGTAGGLNLFNPETGLGRRFTTRDGLPNDFIYGIVEDSNGFLWLTTNKGVSRFDTRLQQFRNYDVSDGLQGNEFNAGAFARTSTGALLVGGVTGFNVISPTVSSARPIVPRLVLTSFRVMHTERVFERLLSEMQTITLQHTENLFSIEFAALDYLAPSKVQYFYKLDGVDKNWVQAGSRRFAAYSELEPGEYIFHVKAVNTGAWPEQAIKLTIVIAPPFWKTLWFQTFAALCLTTSMWGAHRIRLHSIEQQNKRLQMMVDERTQELRTTNEELTVADEEIRRQNTMLEEQTAHIELANTELQQKNVELHEVNEQLEIYGREMERYSKTLEEQGRAIELVNSELHERNSQLATANEQLEALNQRKNELLGIVAHDLKNPLSAILMSATMMQRYIDRMKPDDVLKSIGNIRETGDRMHKIIVDLLDVEAIESGTFKLVLEPVNVVDSALQTVQDYTERAAQKNIIVHFKPNIERITAKADAGALRQVLDNLVSNALKYSPAGKQVWITVQEQQFSLRKEAVEQGMFIGALIHDADDEALSQRVQVRVRDEGPGLSLEDQQKLFGRFAKLTPRPTAGEHSTGLGLSIVKQLVEAMGGRVWCESTIGSGAEFIVELPLAK
jgi:signal transduction histidine kinase/ligand-binding sensor domain-containing protein